MLAILHSHGILTEIFVSKRVRFLSKTAHFNVTLVKGVDIFSSQSVGFFLANLNSSVLDIRRPEGNH